MPNRKCVVCNHDMIASPNYRGKNPKCDECRYTSDSMVFSDGASPLSDFWEEHERAVQVADGADISDVPVAAAALVAASLADLEVNDTDECAAYDHMSQGSIVYVIFNAWHLSGGEALYKGEIIMYDYITKRYIVYFRANGAKIEWKTKELAHLVNEAESFIKERSIPKSEIGDVLKLSHWNRSKRSVPAAAANPVPSTEKQNRHDVLGQLSIGCSVYILFDADSSNASIYKGELRKYNCMSRRYTVYFPEDGAEIEWRGKKLDRLIKKTESFIKERSIPKSEIGDVLKLSQWNSSEKVSDTSSAGDSKDGDASGPSAGNKTEPSHKERWEKISRLVGQTGLYIEELSINGAMSNDGKNLLMRVINDATMLRNLPSQCLITAFENIRCNKFVLVEWKEKKKYAGKMNFISEFPNTATYVSHNKIWLDRLRKIYTNWAGDTSFLILVKKWESCVFMGLAKISYLDGDERDYLIAYNQNIGFFYALNYYGAHRIDIYSSAEERPESDDERRWRVENERRELRERVRHERIERERNERERKECERMARKCEERKRFEARKRERVSKDTGGAAGGRCYSNDPPKSFLCPITCDLMMDPVIACDGYSYERSAIEKWLSKSRKSPMTGLGLKSIDLISNHGLKGAISEWLDD